MKTKQLTKIIAAVMLLTVMALAFAGCAKDDGEGGKTLSASFEDIYQKIEEDTELSGLMTIPGTDSESFLGMTGDEYISEVAGLDAEKLESYFVAFSPVNIKADTIAFFEVKDSADIEAVKEGAQKIIDNRKTGFYLPDQNEVAENAKIEVYEDKYVVMVMTTEQDGVIATFESFLQ